MNVAVSFPGGVSVDAELGGHVVHTDQPRPHGGDSAPAPFDLFLASIATCMGFYALRFCQERGITTDGLGLSLETVRDESRKRLSAINAALTLPPGFPEKYSDAIRRAVDQCAVKKHLIEPPAFAITVSANASRQDGRGEGHTKFEGVPLWPFPEPPHGARRNSRPQPARGGSG